MKINEEKLEQLAAAHFAGKPIGQYYDSSDTFKAGYRKAMQCVEAAMPSDEDIEKAGDTEDFMYPYSGFLNWIRETLQERLSK